MNSKEDVASDRAANVALLKSLEGAQMLIAVYDAEDRLVFSNSTFNRAFHLEGGTHPMTFSDLILHAATYPSAELSGTDPLTLTLRLIDAARVSTVETAGIHC